MCANGRRAWVAHPLALVDEIVPGFHGRAHVLLGYEEPVVGELELAACLADNLKVREVLCCAVDQRVLDAPDLDAVRELLALQVHLVDRDAFAPHAEQQRRRLHLRLDFLDQRRLLLLRRRQHRRHARAQGERRTRVEHGRQQPLRKTEGHQEETTKHGERSDL